MTNFEKIETYLKKGLHVLVKDEDDKYCVISPFKDGDGNYRDSASRDSAKEAKANIGRYYGDDEEYWNTKTIEIIETFPTPYEPYEVGDKVRIRRNGLVGMVEEIGSDLLVRIDSETSFFSEHFDLDPVIEEDDETITIEGKKYTLSEIKKALNK